MLPRPDSFSLFDRSSRPFSESSIFRRLLLFCSSFSLLFIHDLTAVLPPRSFWEPNFPFIFFLLCAILLFFFYLLFFIILFFLSFAMFLFPTPLSLVLGSFSILFFSSHRLNLVSFLFSFSPVFLGPLSVISDLRFLVSYNFFYPLVQIFDAFPFWNLKYSFFSSHFPWSSCLGVDPVGFFSQHPIPPLLPPLFFHRSPLRYPYRSFHISPFLVLWSVLQFRPQSWMTISTPLFIFILYQLPPVTSGFSIFPVALQPDR